MNPGNGIETAKFKTKQFKGAGATLPHSAPRVGKKKLRLKPNYKQYSLRENLITANNRI